MANAPELHVNLVVVIFIDQLEVLHRGFVYSAVKIEYEGLDSCTQRKGIRLMRVLTFVPLRRLIKEEHYIFSVILFKLLLDSVIAIRRFPHELPLVSIYVRQEYLHSPRPLGSQ